MGQLFPQGLFRLGARSCVAERHVDAAGGELAGDDEPDPLAAGDQSDLVFEIHKDKCNHENTKTRRRKEK